MSTKVGSIHYDLSLDTSKFDNASNNIKSQVDGVGKGFDGLGSKLAAVGKTLAVVGAAGTAALGAMTVKMLNSGAQFEQMIGGSEAVFGEFAKNIQETARTAYTQMGLSQNEFLQGANKMGSLFQGAGFSVQESMKMSSESMQRASDIASIMGISTTDALEAVTGMAKGNFTMMDNLGVAMNDTAIQAYALSKGIDKSTQQMSIQEKVGLAQQMFMEKTAKFAGNYAKENDTLAGSINTTRKAFEDFISGAGDIRNFLDSLINTIKIAVPQVVRILPRIVEALGVVLSGLAPVIAQTLPTLLPAFINALMGLFKAIVAQLPNVIKTLVAALPLIIDGFIQLFLGLLQALPEIITIIAEAMPTIIDALVTGLTNPTAITAIIMASIQVLMALINAIPIIIPALVNAIPQIIRTIVTTLTSPQFISAMINASYQLMGAFIRAIGMNMGALMGALWQVLGIIADTLSPANLGRIGRDMIIGLWNGIASLAGWIGSKIQGFVANMTKDIKKFFGIRSPSTVFAGIGENLSLGLAKGLLNSQSAIDNAMNRVLPNPTITMNALNRDMGTMTPSAPESTINTNISINGDINLGDKSAVTEFFGRLNRNNELAQKGLAVL